MTYLSSTDQYKLNILETYPKRLLTTREVLIKDIMDFDWTYPDSDNPRTVREGQENKARLQDLINTQLIRDNALMELATQALTSQQARQTLFDKFPMVKHYDLITDPPTKGILGLTLAQGASVPVGMAVHFLTTLRAIHQMLPSNTSPSFVATPATPPHRETRQMAVNAKDPALFGTSAPPEVSNLLKTLFSNSSQLLEAIERFDVAKEYGFLAFQIHRCPHFINKQYLHTVCAGSQYNFYIGRR